MHVLVITNAYPSTQKPYAGIFVKNQIEELKRYYDVDVFYLERRFTTSIGSVLKYFVSTVRFTSYLFKKYQILHIHFLSPLLITAYIYKILHPKCVLYLTPHGSDVNRLHKQGLIFYFYKFLIRKVDYILPVSNTISDKTQYLFEREPVLYLPAGVNKKIFFVTQHDLLHRDIDLLYVGSFYSHKGVPNIINILQRYPDRLNVRFVGSGELELNIKSLQSTHSITIINNATQEELANIYRRAKYLILLSKSEGFPLVIPEALYCGTPCIVFDYPPMNNMIHHGKNGYILSEENPVSEMKEVLNVTPQRWENLSKHASQSLEEASLDTIINKLVDHYNSNFIC